MILGLDKVCFMTGTIENSMVRVRENGMSAYIIVQLEVENEYQTGKGRY